MPQIHTITAAHGFGTHQFARSNIDYKNGSLVLFENPVSDSFNRVSDSPGVDMIAPAIVSLTGQHDRSLL
jgi:hypothetical protein